MQRSVRRCTSGYWAKHQDWVCRQVSQYDEGDDDGDEGDDDEEDDGDGDDENGGDDDDGDGDGDVEDIPGNGDLPTALHTINLYILQSVAGSHLFIIIINRQQCKVL